jgi:hypothetical protein
MTRQRAILYIGIIADKNQLASIFNHNQGEFYTISRRMQENVTNIMSERSHLIKALIFSNHSTPKS